MTRAGPALAQLSAALLDAGSLARPVAVRTAALLLRQGIEMELDHTLARTLPGTENGSFRAKLLCLEHLDRRVGVGVSGVWRALTDVCHHHHYELAPNSESVAALAAECERWLDELDALPEGTD